MTKDIASKQATEIVKHESGRGFEEGVDKDELIIPRAKLLQALSPELEGSDLKAGDIINSVTLEKLSPQFIPIFKFTQWIRFNPRDSKAPGFNPDFGPGEMVWRSNDPNDEKVKTESVFGPNGEKPLATRFLNFFSYFEGADMPVIISFSNTSFKAGKRLMSLAKFRGGDMFSKRYKLASKKETNDMGSYYVFDVSPAGNTDEAVYKQAETWWKEYSLKASDIQVHAETESVDRVF